MPFFAAYGVMGRLEYEEKQHVVIRNQWDRNGLIWRGSQYVCEALRAYALRSMLNFMPRIWGVVYDIARN